MENFDQKIRNKLFSLEYNQAPDNDLMAGMFERLDKRLDIETAVIEISPEKEKRNSYGAFLRIAASVIILIAVGFGLYQVNEVNLYALKGSKAMHKLPDGSSVALNADSKIEYNKLTWMFTRSLSLEGEAFFEVEKGEKFKVASDWGSTQVLGTSFNIYSRGQDYIVECITGRVKVNYVGSLEKIVLTPGKGIKYNESENGTKFSNDNENFAEWRTGEFHFDNEPLKNVIGVLSRQYNIEVKLDNKYEQKKYTGYFNDKNLDTALKLICDPIELNYQVRDGYVVIE
jgi:ferric-dicitrate binding protein FerR (iron transport regulator)